MLQRKVYLILILILSLCLFNSCLVSEDGTVVFNGKVVDPSGVGISSVKVKVDCIFENKEIETDLNGNYTFQLAHGGTAFLLFSKDGYVPQSKTFAFEDGETVTYTQKLEIFQDEVAFLQNITRK